MRASVQTMHGVRALRCFFRYLKLMKKHEKALQNVPLNERKGSKNSGAWVVKCELYSLRMFWNIDFNFWHFQFFYPIK